MKTFIKALVWTVLVIILWVVLRNVPLWISLWVIGGIAMYLLFGRGSRLMHETPSDAIERHLVLDSDVVQPPQYTGEESDGQAIDPWSNPQ